MYHLHAESRRRHLIMEPDQSAASFSLRQTIGLQIPVPVTDTFTKWTGRLDSSGIFLPQSVKVRSTHSADTSGGCYVPRSIFTLTVTGNSLSGRYLHQHMSMYLFIFTFIEETNKSNLFQTTNKLNRFILLFWFKILICACKSLTFSSANCILPQ